MRNRTALALVGLFLLSSSNSVRAADVDFSVTTKVSVEPAVKPGVGYFAKVEIADATTGEVLFAPSVGFKQGGPAKATMKMDNGDWIAFEIEVTKSGDRATYSIDRSREGQSRRVEEVTIQLAGAPELAVVTKVTVEPAKAPAGAYLATVEVSNARTGEVLSAPSIAFLPGAGAAGGGRTRSGIGDGSEIVVFVQISDAGDKATYSVDRVRDQQSVRLQEATITLAR